MFATTTVLGVMRWPEDAHLLVLGICSFAAASAGRLAWRRQGTWHLPGGWAISHITGMSGSHIVLLTAFYPNNARTRRFGATCHTPPTGCCPSAFGIPLVVRALRRHRARHYDNSSSLESRTGIRIG